jgi:hypothetical protein
MDLPEKITTMLKRIQLLTCFLLAAAITATAQPYLDVINVRYSRSPDFQFVNPSSDKTDITYINVSTTLPLVFKNKDAIILSPYFETWKLNLANDAKNHYGMILPVSYLKHFGKRWSLLSTAIIRGNDSAVYQGMKKQVGAAVIVSHQVRAGLTFKAGLYVNDEYFGLFVMPLAGIDWQINERNVLFGVLPGSLTYQHRLSSLLSYGANFRAQTNSYYRPSNNFTRIDENQLGGFLDLYVTRQLVVNFEAGFSVLRKVRTGKNNYCNCKYVPYDVNDNLYFKLAFAYRMPLR